MRQDIAQQRRLIEALRLLNASSGHAGVTCLECREAAFWSWRFNEQQRHEHRPRAGSTNRELGLVQVNQFGLN